MLAVEEIIADPGYEPFVAKVQKARTRKDKDYFVLRVSVPKGVASNLAVHAGDYLFFKTKKAEWYHMLDWREVGEAWSRLPSSVQTEIVLAGLPNPSTPRMIESVGVQAGGNTLTAPAAGFMLGGQGVSMGGE
jgi:hypothetical protein